MTRLDPTGTDGTELTTGTLGGISCTVSKSGTGSVMLSAAAGADRGNNRGIRASVPGGATEQANLIFSTGSANTYAVAQAWINVRIAPSGAGWLKVFDFRGSGGNLASMVLSSSLQIQLQNSAGTNVGSILYTLSAGAWYRVQLSMKAGASSTGEIMLQLWDNADNVLVSGTNLTSQNVGSTNPQTLRIGESETTAGTQTGLMIDYAQAEIVTGATLPTIATITKNSLPSTMSRRRRAFNGTNWT